MTPCPPDPPQGEVRPDGVRLVAMRLTPHGLVPAQVPPDDIAAFESGITAEEQEALVIALDSDWAGLSDQGDDWATSGLTKLRTFTDGASHAE